METHAGQRSGERRYHSQSFGNLRGGRSNGGWGPGNMGREKANRKRVEDVSRKPKNPILIHGARDEGEVQERGRQQLRKRERLGKDRTGARKKGNIAASSHRHLRRGSAITHPGRATCHQWGGGKRETKIHVRRDHGPPVPVHVRMPFRVTGSENARG